MIDTVPKGIDTSLTDGDPPQTFNSKSLAPWKI